MLRYEIHSNVASSEQGLQLRPALDDLVRTLAARHVEVRVVQQRFTEEAEVNLASSRHAQGVTVRGRAMRTLPAQAHLRGCLAWLRAVAMRPERGMHADIAEVRAVNGTALLLAQVLGRSQQVFLTVPDALWPRLMAVPDRTFGAMPPEIATSDALRQDYLDRATRPTGFLAAMQRLATLALLPVPLATALAQGRGAEPVQGLTEAQIVNIALFDEVVERYERLVDQVCTLLPAEGALGDLPQLFELLLQGVPLEGLRAHFDAYLLPDRREEAGSKRLLVHELRIGLRQAAGPTREQFRNRLLREVVLLRAVQDPRLYARAQRLPSMDAKRLEALEAPRASFLAWLSNPAAAMPAAPPAAPPAAGLPATPSGETGAAPPAVRIALFELMVNLTYQARFAQSYRPGGEPLSVLVARQLLDGFSVRNLDRRQLPRLNPALPARGVARALAAKVTVTGPEVQRIQLALWTALFPLGRVAGTLHRELAATQAENQRKAAAQARTAFLFGAYRLLRATNYVLGQAGGEPLLRQAALAAGNALGQTLLSSRDQIHRRAPAAADADSLEQEAEGYQMLMVKGDVRWFPLRAAAPQLAGAYLYLVRERIAESVRRLIAKKLNYLVQRHGTALFAVMHDHVVWDLGLTLTHTQLAAVLLDAGVFDGARLREFGYRDQAEPGADGAASDTDDTGSTGGALGDPLLQAALAGTSGAHLEPFLGSRSEARCRAALKAINAHIASCGPPDAPQDASQKAPPRLTQALATLAAQECLDLRDPAARKALAATREADALTKALQHLLAPHEAALAALREGNDALELPLSGRWALLALLREHHTLTLAEQPQQVRLVRSVMPGVKAAPPSGRTPGTHPTTAPAAAVAAELAAALAAHVTAPAGKPLRAALVLLEQHQTVWRTLVQAALLPLLDQQLRETVLRIAEPARPLPRDLRALPPGQVLCIGASAHDQARFSRVVERPEHPGVFATLSELLSRLVGFNRLREELESYREIIGDLREVIAGLNLSIYDAPYVRRYAQGLAAIDATLSVRPEELTAADLAELEAQAQALGTHVRTSYERERTVPLRDRWMNRIAVGLRRMHPTLHLTFVDALHEQARAPLPEAGDTADAAGQAAGTGTGAPAGKSVPEGRARGEDYQTFSERVRRIVAFRERMETVRAIVLAPNNTQQRLALTVVDTLYRLKGVHTPIFVDSSGCESFVEALRTRIPSHRLFDMNAL